MFYRGWVPTVNGRLSFKLVGEARYPSESDYANFSTTTHQYALAVQTRNLSDVLFDKFLSKILGVSGDFDFYLCGRSRRGLRSADAPLIGKLYLFRTRSAGSEAVQIGVQKSLEKMRATAFHDSNGDGRKCYLSTHKLLASYCDIASDFVLRRNGMLSITRLTWTDNDFARNSIDYERSRSIDLEQSVADQFYFFVRDVTHQHQHHGPDADTIITTQKSGYNDLRWCNSIVYSLYFHIINVKRRPDPVEHVRVLGILAYLQSFKKIAELRSEEAGLPLKLPYFNDATAKESITATKNYIDLLATRQKQSSDEFRTVLFTVSAILLTMVNFISGFADPTVKPAPWMTGIANFLKQHAYLCVVPLVFILVWWASNKIVKPKYDFKRDVIRLSLVNRAAAVVVLVVVAILVLLVAIWIGAPALPILVET